MRFRELSLTYNAPERFAARFGAQSLAITVAVAISDCGLRTRVRILRSRTTAERRTRERSESSTMRATRSACRFRAGSRFSSVLDSEEPTMTHLIFRRAARTTIAATAILLAAPACSVFDTMSPTRTRSKRPRLATPRARQPSPTASTRQSRG